MILNSSTLILNKSWIPIAFVNVKDAIRILYTDRAKVVCSETFNTYHITDWVDMKHTDGKFIKSVNFDLKVPEVIILSEYNKIPEIKTSCNKKNLLKRDNNTCQYCGKKHKSLTIDHIIPICRGGKTDWDNCVLACKECNFKKKNLLLKEARMKLINKPYKPKWSIADLINKNRPRSWNNFIKCGE